MGQVNHDHFCLSWTYCLNCKKQRDELKPRKLNYRRGNYLIIKEHLNRIDLDTVESSYSHLGYSHNPHIITNLKKMLGFNS